MRRAIQNAIEFARFSQEYGIPPAELGQMVDKAMRSKRAYEAGLSAQEQRLGGEVEQIAAQYGCKVTWPGLWPMVEKPGVGDRCLPAFE